MVFSIQKKQIASKVEIMTMIIRFFLFFLGCLLFVAAVVASFRELYEFPVMSCAIVGGLLICVACKKPPLNRDP